MSFETPLMKQYAELKEQAGNALLLFRMGDFYELFGDDAIQASRILGLTLTSRDKGKENAMPMAGVPFHSIDNYLQKLLQAGKKVAIGEQVEDPEEAKKRGGSKAIVRREIIRTYSPAVQFESDRKQAQYLGCIFPVPSPSKEEYFFALLEPSTGECRISGSLSSDSLQEELLNDTIPHLLTVGEIPLPEFPNRLIEPLPQHILSQDAAERLIRLNYQGIRTDAFLPLPEQVLVLGALIQYTCKLLKKERLEHLQLPMPLQNQENLVLSTRASQHLDLIELFEWLDRTQTAMGSRLLKTWLHAPLKKSAPLQERQQAIQELHLEIDRSSRVRKSLSDVYDLDRLLGRLSAGLFNPRDASALAQSILQVPEILKTLERFQTAALKKLFLELSKNLDPLLPLASKLKKALKVPAPLVIRDGDIFNTGFHPELDHFIQLTTEGAQWLVKLEAREREATGIASLKVRYNRVFGYYIEITSAHLKNVPAHYQRKQTMVGAERFFTEELKTFEEEILSASSKQKALECELFQSLVEELKTHVSSFMALAHDLATLDALASLSQLPDSSLWCFPTFDEGLELKIEAGKKKMEIDSLLK
jgi:DNA mismatch repair protein MutS